MNWKTFAALLARDTRVVRRNLMPLLLQTLLQPLLIVFIFGRVMVGNGMLNGGFRTVLLPGIIGLAMVSSGIQAVAMPLMGEFQYTREIEDRLLAPIDIKWLAIERVLGGVFIALIAGGVAVLGAVLLMGRNLNITFDHIPVFVVVLLLVALLSATGGLAIGCSVDATQIGMMFSLVVAPMFMFGCTYYPWTSLAKFPILQKAVLVNPLVYASEGLRGTLAPQIPHLSLVVVITVLVGIDVALMAVGLNRFYRKSIG
jgi:ABC-2 type transport system permease protein